LEFCALNIQKLELNGRMMEDGSMRVDIGLNAFTMDDRRKNARIKRLMDKKDTGSTDQFVTVKYSQNTGGDKFGKCYLIQYNYKFYEFQWTFSHPNSS
jgi:hypothetical protein